MNSPRVPHLKAALHLVKYLKGTIDTGFYDIIQIQILQSKHIVTLTGVLVNSAVDL